MLTVAPRSLAAGLLALAAAVLTASPAGAQYFRTLPPGYQGQIYSQAAAQAAFAGTPFRYALPNYASTYTPGYIPGYAPGYSPGYYPPYYPGFYDTGLGGTLSGTADAITAQGQFNISNQQARLLNEQVKQSKVDTRRKIYEQWLWEQANTPTLQENLEKMQREQLRYSRNDPNLGDILSGTALNNLLKDAQKIQTQGRYGPAIPLDEELMRHINVTGSGTGGNVGLLKDNGQLKWPLVLTGEAFTEDRGKVERLLAQAVGQARSGGVDPGTLNDLEQTVERMRRRLAQDIGEISPTKTVQGKRYLKELDDAIRGLQDPNVGNYFNQKWTARGTTVGELVQHMSTQGLQFAPATTGDEAAYRALHNALAAYDVSLQNSVARK